MIRIFKLNDSFNNWPAFNTYAGALVHLKNNSGAFDNGDVIALVNFETQETKFVIARFSMCFEEIK